MLKNVVVKLFYCCSLKLLQWAKLELPCSLHGRTDGAP